MVYKTNYVFAVIVFFFYLFSFAYKSRYEKKKTECALIASNVYERKFYSCRIHKRVLNVIVMDIGKKKKSTHIYTHIEFAHVSQSEPSVRKQTLAR